MYYYLVCVEVILEQHEGFDEGYHIFNHYCETKKAPEFKAELRLCYPPAYCDHVNNRSWSRIQVNHFLASQNIPVAPQPPYSPDLSPCDFFLVPKLKNHLKGHHFGTLESIQTAVTDLLKAIPIPPVL
ncbi:putative transposase [Trichonephila clavipes]|nr:putative transposase [Trichonephila clavipes]